MRQIWGCLLVEAHPGNLSELQRRLEKWRVGCGHASAAEGEATPAGGADILVVEIAGDLPAAAAHRIREWRMAGRPVLAICPAADPKLVSLAASCAADEILVCPLDEDELAQRLDLLSTLGRLQAEKARRAALLATFLVGGQPRSPSRGRPERRPVVCVLGDASGVQVRVAEALSDATLSYVERPSQLKPYFDGGGADVLVITRPDAIEKALETVNRLGEPAALPQLIAVHRGELTPWHVPPQVDLVALTVPPEILRARLVLALRLARLRRWLRDPPSGTGANLVLDSLSQLYNQGVLLGYLAAHAGGPAAALLAVRVENLASVNAQQGYAAGNLALAEVGRHLARLTRAEDLPARLGGGRFAVAVTAPIQAQLERIRLRLDLGLGQQASLADAVIATGVEPLPVRGAPVERVTRLFRELGRTRRAA
jgi:diguanylate cyclase (GGDEF)-like protein